MAGFKEDVVFPENINYGSVFGSGFNTQIITLDSGEEERIQRWGGSGRRRYNAKYGIKTIEDLQAVNLLHMIVQGSTYGFKFKDWMDYSTGQDGLDSIVGFEDVQIGVGDGTKTQFQLTKNYTLGTTSLLRNLTKPVEGTVRVGLNGVELLSNFTVNYTNGVITASVAPNAGVVVTAGCEFYVPVRFGKEVDAGIPIELVDFEIGSVPDIPLVEDIDTRFANEAFNFGGAKDHGNMSNADVALTSIQGRAHCFAPTQSGLAVRMPDETNLPTGGPYFFLANTGSVSLAIEDSAQVNIDTLPANRSAMIVLGVDSGLNKTWYAQIS